MAWKLAWSVHGLRDLESLDPNVARRIHAKLHTVLDDPPRHLQRLKGRSDWKLRIGDWRVSLLLSDETETALVQQIGHRSTVYR